MNTYYRYLGTFVAAMVAQSSKHRGQRMPKSRQGYARYMQTQRRRRAARKHSQRQNRS